MSIRRNGLSVHGRRETRAFDSTPRFVTRVHGVTVLLALVLGVERAGAQSLAPVTYGRLTGEVIDSLFTKAPLADADVVIEGIPRSIRTDARGRFILDSVPVGSYRVGFFHPSIDELGLQAATVTVRVVAEEVATLRLATPAPATVYGVLCGTPATEGRGMVVGAARGVPSNAPIALARVVAQWSEVVIRNGRIARESPARLGAVTPTGGYVICGLPADADVTVIGVVDDGRRGVISVLPAGAMVSARVLRLADSTSVTPRRGMIVQRSGAAVAAARIEVSKDTTLMRSGTDGRFPLSANAPAAGELRITGVGYRPLRTVLDSAARDIVVTLDALSAQELAAITVEGQRVRSEAPDEFEARRKAGFGNFITQADIQRRNPIQLFHMFDGMPGLMVNQSSGRVINLRGASLSGGCEPNYFVDGIRFDVGQGNAQGPLTFFDPNQIAGIEVYRGVAALPPQYGGSNAACGAVLIWTRRGGVRR
jgi:hypothetical protein